MVELGVPPHQAWTCLEKAEHEREASLRNELIRQEKLELLAQRFDHKAVMRETWLNENQRLVSQVGWDPWDPPHHPHPGAGHLGGLSLPRGWVGEDHNAWVVGPPGLPHRAPSLSGGVGSTPPDGISPHFRTTLATTCRRWRPP